MSNTRRFIAINTNLNLHDARLEEISIDYRRSLLDFNAVIINVSKLTNYGYCQKEYKSKRLLDTENTAQLVSDFDSIKRQLEILLKQGKNVYVFIGQDEGCYINKKDAHDEYEYISPLSFLPQKNVLLSTLNGDTFQLLDSKYKPIFDSLVPYMTYKAVIESKSVIPIIEIPNSGSIIGGCLEYGAGKIIFLPHVSILEIRGKKLYNEKKELFDALYDFDEHLSNMVEPVAEIPSWVDDYKILNEENEIAVLEKKKKELQNIQKEISKQEEKIATLKRYKSILTSTGIDLENKVKDILVQIGFQLFPSKKCRCDLIAKYGDKDIVIEVKGLTKSASEDNTMQLEKWVIEFNDVEKRIPKSILLVNGFLKLPLEARKENVFPLQMQKLSKGRGQCLMTTTQLLCLFIEISENPKCKETRITELLNTEGVYTRYSNYSRFIKKVK